MQIQTEKNRAVFNTPSLIDRAYFNFCVNNNHSGPLVAWLQLSAELVHLGRHAEAMHAAQKALEISPDLEDMKKLVEVLTDLKSPATPTPPKKYPERFVTATLNGIKFELDLNEAIDRVMYETGEFEIETANALRLLSTIGGTFFDIGANVGAYTLPLARAIGNSGRVYAFEPMPWAQKKLLKNIALNDINNITVEAYAISDSSFEEEVCFATSWPVVGESEPSANDKSLTRFITIDEYVETNKISRVDLMKIDADGYDVRVIDGAKATIAKFLPRMVLEVCHYSLADQFESTYKLFDTLYSYGYQIYQIGEMWRYRDIAHISSSVPDGSGINVIAAR